MSGLKISPQEAVSSSLRWLAEHPDAPLAERVCFGLVVAAAGEVGGPCTIGDVARYAGCEPGEALQGLYAARDLQEARAGALDGDRRRRAGSYDRRDA